MIESNFTTTLTCGPVLMETQSARKKPFVESVKLETSVPGVSVVKGVLLPSRQKYLAWSVGESANLVDSVTG